MFRFALSWLVLKADGSKVAAGSDDGTVIIWSYPEESKQVFRRNGRSNFPLIVWNPFNRDVLASYNNAVSVNKYSH
jgi:transducin (beta)-like 1